MALLIKCYMRTAVSLLIVSVIGALQWRYLLSLLKLHCSGVAYCLL